MKILHGTWIPSSGDEFIQSGNFYLWVETDTPPKQQKNLAVNRHPQQLNKDDLSTFLGDELGITPKNSSISRDIVTKYFILPSTEDRPLPSVELTRYLETESPAPTTWQIWAIDCYQVNPIVKLLNDIHFLCLYSNSAIQMGADLLCWYHYSQFIEELLHKDRYIPALKYREHPPTTSKNKKTAPGEQIYPGWEIISQAYETNIQKYLNHLPLVCTGGLNTTDAPIEFYDKETLLRHFSECLLHDYVANTPIPGTFEKKIANSRLLTGCLNLQNSSIPWTDSQALAIYKQWQTWKQKLVAAQNNSAFQLCFQLQEASTQTPDRWYLKFLVAAKQDPSKNGRN